MKNIDWKKLNIKPHNIVVAETSEPDWEMNRIILLELDPGIFVILEGGHCSCYGFDETEWEAIEYTEEEIKKLASADYNKESDFWKKVKIQLRG